MLVAGRRAARRPDSVRRLPPAAHKPSAHGGVRLCLLLPLLVQVRTYADCLSVLLKFDGQEDVLLCMGVMQEAYGDSPHSLAVLCFSRRYVQEHGCCPITRLPCSVDHIRKLYTSV